MTKDDKEIVSVLRKRLADKVGQDRFDLWFNTSVELATDGQTLLVLGSHAFTLERLHKAFRTDLEAVACDVFGPEANVRFSIAQAGEVRRVVESPVVVPVKIEPIAQLAVVVSPPPPSSDSRPHRRLATLETYVVGDTNRLAHAAARSVEMRLGQMSPLFIHGPTGSGKTHLLEGICTAVRKHRDRRAISLSAEQFTSYFLEALQGSGLPNFRRKYRDVDLLLIDDVQFFAGKKATLVELQHTMDTIARAGKQLVLVADRPPAELASLGSELCARMSAGLVCGVEAPDEPTRYGILVNKAARLGVPMPDEVLRQLAAQLPGDGRQLGGALNRIAAVSEAYQQPVTMKLAMDATGDLLQSTRRAVQLVDIERAICNVFGIEPELLHAKKRTKQVNVPRMLAMWLARKYTRSALTEIGEYFGRRSHSTVIAAQNNVERLRGSNDAVQLAHSHCGMDDAIRRVMSELRVG